MARSSEPEGRKRQSRRKAPRKTQAELDELYAQFGSARRRGLNSPRRANLTGTPFAGAEFRVYFITFESSSTEAEHFLHNPVRALTGGVPGIDPLPPGDARLVARAKNVSTVVVNHERTLAAKGIYATVTVANPTVSIHIFKQLK